MSSEPQIIDTRADEERFRSWREFYQKLGAAQARCAAYAPPSPYLLRPDGTLEELRATQPSAVPE